VQAASGVVLEWEIKRMGLPGQAPGQVPGQLGAAAWGLA